MSMTEQRIMIPSLLLVLLVFGIWNDGNYFTVSANPLPGNDLQLSLSLSSDQAQPQAPHPAAVKSKLMEQIMNDEIGDDFQLSAASLNQMKAILEEFAQKGGVSNNDAPISSWIGSHGGQANHIYQAAEMDLVYKSFWSDFSPLIGNILTNKPPNLTHDSLDYRCKKAAELQRLKEMGKQSALYALYIDTFFSELHQHCLMRKLAMIKLHNASPSSLVTQFVDIYLDLPTNNPASVASKEARDHVAGQLLAGLALNFNLEQAVARHGKLENVADLIFDPRVALSMNSSGAKQVVENFKRDCDHHAKQLASIWGDFDEVARFLSSETCNFSDFNEQLKLAAPQLVYATLCSRLMTVT